MLRLISGMRDDVNGTRTRSPVVPRSPPSIAAAAVASP